MLIVQNVCGDLPVFLHIKVRWIWAVALQTETKDTGQVRGANMMMNNYALAFIY